LQAADRGHVAHIRNHVVRIDEATPTDSGVGPNPMELLLAALGGCLCIVITMLAPQHEVAISSLAVEVEGDLDPRGFRGEDPDVRPGFSSIRYKVDLSTPAPEERVDTLLAHVARVCPVKDTLRGTEVVALEFARHDG
jgi:uncharacterized OsmC-like protein